MGTRINKLKLMSLFFLMFLLSSSVALAKKFDINIYLFYASWNANSQKAQEVTSTVANTYKERVGYRAFDVDDEETYKFIKSNKLNMPKYLPSVVIVNKHKKVLNTTPYKNQDEVRLKNALDGDILPNI
jgi:hypothetical protein